MKRNSFCLFQIQKNLTEYTQIYQELNCSPISGELSAVWKKPKRLWGGYSNCSERALEFKAPVAGRSGTVQKINRFDNLHFLSTNGYEC